MGDQAAAVNLGLIYLRGVPREAVRARQLFRRLAHVGNIQAAMVYATLELRGVGGPADEGAGLAWLKRVLRTGSPDLRGQAQNLISAFSEASGRGGDKTAPATTRR